jgi:hypothetical protein
MVPHEFIRALVNRALRLIPSRPPSISAIKPDNERMVLTGHLSNSEDLVGVLDEI